MKPIGNKIWEKILNLLNDEDGLTIVEYALVGALIAAALVVTFGLLGDQVGALITFLTSELS